jgi:hypothetical protein
LNVVYGCLFAVAGGYVTAWLAPAQPLRHAMALGLIMAVLAIITGLAVAAAPPSPEDANQPGWYYLVLALTVLPCVTAGGWLCSRRPGIRTATRAQANTSIPRNRMRRGGPIEPIWPPRRIAFAREQR